MFVTSLSVAIKHENSEQCSGGGGGGCGLKCLPAKGSGNSALNQSRPDGQSAVCVTRTVTVKIIIIIIITSRMQPSLFLLSPQHAV